MKIREKKKKDNMQNISNITKFLLAIELGL